MKKEPTIWWALFLSLIHGSVKNMTAIVKN